MIPFSEYYDEVSRLLVDMGETCPPDKGTVEEDQLSGMTPQESAQAFYDDWNSQ